MDENVTELIFENSNGSQDIMEQFLSSDCLEDNCLMIDKFLDNEDNTIDLDKLELSIILLVEYLENSVKDLKPIYINIGNMDVYVQKRNIQKNLERITEESSFILGFSQSIADENKIDREIIVRFRGNDE